MAVHRRDRSGLSRRGDGHISFARLPGLHDHLGGLFLQIHHRRYLDPGRAAVTQIKMRPRDADQPHLPVQSAVKGEIRLLRVHPVVIAIVHGDGQGVFLTHTSGKVHPEGRVAALVAGQFFTVEVHLRRHGGSGKFQPGFAALLQSGAVQLTDIPAGPPVIVVAAVLAVGGVPGVGQRYGFAGCLGGLQRAGGGLDKGPAGVEQHNGSHMVPPC